eukprot:UN26118
MRNDITVSKMKFIKLSLTFTLRLLKRKLHSLLLSVYSIAYWNTVTCFYPIRKAMGGKFAFPKNLKPNSLYKCLSFD